MRSAAFAHPCASDYSHRKQWVLERLQHLTSAYALDICAYAIMSNHYHLVLQVDQAKAKAWSREEVVTRWASMFSVHAEAWQLAMQPRGNVFGRAMGRLDHLRLHANTLGQSWVRGLRQAEQLYSA